MEIEIEKMWCIKATTEPIIVGALGMIMKETYKNTIKILGRVSR